MQARSALFDLYGDYLRPRGGRAPVAALVRLLAPLGIAAPAVRTAVSRMVRQGWLHPLDRKSTRLNSSHGYISYAVFCLKKKKTEPHSPCLCAFQSHSAPIIA